MARRINTPIRRALLTFTRKQSVKGLTAKAIRASCDTLSSLSRIGHSLTKYANMTFKDLLGKHKKSRTTRRKRAMHVQKPKK